MLEDYQNVLLRQVLDEHIYWCRLSNALVTLNTVFYMNKVVRCSWWRHQMETFSALLVLCAGNSPITGEFLAQKPVTRTFDVFFDLRLNIRLSKQSWGWWFEMPSCSLWHHCNVMSWCIVVQDCLYHSLSMTPAVLHGAQQCNCHALCLIAEGFSDWNRSYKQKRFC